MPTKTVTPPPPEAIPLTLEDVAHLADGADELPDDTAARLKVFIRCNDLDRVRSTWRLIGAHLEELRRIAEDAGIELLVDAVFVFRILERLRSEAWESPGDVLHPRVEVPYSQLIALAGAQAKRAGDTEKTELLQLCERLRFASRSSKSRPAARPEDIRREVPPAAISVRAPGKQPSAEMFLTLFLDLLLEIGEEAAEEALANLTAMYRQRRAFAR